MQPGVKPDARPDATADRWNELRSLLVEPERERLARIEREIANPNLHADAVADALPAAVRQRTTRDSELGEALGPVVGEAIKSSVRRDPQPIVDAISPVIGPAIRRAISAALAELVQTLNTTLEHTFSPRGLAWRWEALRTGKSFGEVVLSHSLLFRVEQLFLIDRDSGLLIEHRAAPGVQALAPDMVASMMTALRDFARDSFSAEASEGLDTLELGDLTVWVESGAQAVLAAVIRGQPPLALRAELQHAIEDVHRIHYADLERFRATGVPFETAPGVLDRCLVSQLQERGGGVAWGTWALIAGAVALVLWFFVPRLIEGRRFDGYVARLRAEPGIVLSHAAREGGRFVVAGLRDPLAADPAALLAASQLRPERVSSNWEPYVALRPAFIERRARATLGAPQSVTLRLAGDTLVASGVAPGRWIAEARQLGRAIAGVGAVRFDDVEDASVLALRARADSVQRISFDFATASAVPLPGQRPRLDSLAAILASLRREGERAARALRITFIGSADSVGSEATNATLRAARAASIRAALVARGVEGTILETESDTSSTARLRQVRLRITLSPSASLSPVR